MWLLADITLCLVNLFHVGLILHTLTPVDSPMKKVSLNNLYKFVRFLDTIPFLEPTFLTFFITLAILTGAMALNEIGDTRIMLIRSLVSFYTFLLACIFMRFTTFVSKLGPKRVMDIEHEEEKYDIAHFKPPAKSLMNAWMAPLKCILNVDVTGIDRFPHDTPHFFVMNHSLLGIEMPFFIHTLFKERNILVRALADHFHFGAPHGPLLRRFGAVDGTRENVHVLMKTKQNLLVYPGGSHEVMKHSSVPRYSLLWKERLGFSRLAIQHRYPIVPCACVGTEDMLKIVFDIPVQFYREGQSLPIAVTTPGKVQKIYVWFGEPISTSQYNGDYENTEFAMEVRDKTKAAVEMGIQELLQKQESDPDRYLMDKFTASVKSASKRGLDVFCESLGLSSPSSGADDTPDTKAKAN